MRRLLHVLALIGLLVSCALSEEKLECSRERQADIFLLLDASGSVGQQNFNQTLHFVESIIDSFPIGPDSVRVGMVTFAKDVDNRIWLNQYMDSSDLLEAVHAIRYTKGNTNTNKALKVARTQAFTEENGGRASAPKFLVLITDGKSSSPDQTKSEATLLAKENITVTAIGVGSDFNKEELELIASSPSLVFDVNSFGALNSIKDQMVKNICEGPTDGEWSEWGDWTECTKSCGGGVRSRERTCTNPAPDNGGQECEGGSQETSICNPDPCPPNPFPFPGPTDGEWSEWGDWTKCTKTCGGGVRSRERTCTNPAPDNGGQECEGGSQETSICNPDPCPPRCKADIYFFLDASGSVGLKNFEQVLGFVKLLVHAFPIGSDNVRVGLETFAGRLANRISLNTYMNETELLEAVDSVRYTKGRTSTHKALKKARTVFDVSRGGREDVPNYLVVVTDGQSNNPQKTKAEASLLAKEDITVLAIGVGSQSNKEELGLIASSPSLVFDVKSFLALQDIKDDLVAKICGDDYLEALNSINENRL